MKPCDSLPHMHHLVICWKLVILLILSLNLFLYKSCNATIHPAFTLINDPSDYGITLSKQAMFGVINKYQDLLNDPSGLTYINTTNTLSTDQLAYAKSAFLHGNLIVLDASENKKNEQERICADITGISLSGDIIFTRRNRHDMPEIKSISFPPPNKSPIRPKGSSDNPVEKVIRASTEILDTWLDQTNKDNHQRSITWPMDWRPEISIPVELRYINFPCLVGSGLQDNIIPKTSSWSDNLADACDNNASVSLFFIIDLIRSIDPPNSATDNSKYFRITMDPESTGGAGWYLTDRPIHKHTRFLSWTDRDTWYGPIADHYAIEIASDDDQVRLYNTIPPNRPRWSKIHSVTKLAIGVFTHVTATQIHGDQQQTFLDDDSSSSEDSDASDYSHPSLDADASVYSSSSEDSDASGYSSSTSIDSDASYTHIHVLDNKGRPIEKLLVETTDGRAITSHLIRLVLDPDCSYTYDRYGNLMHKDDYFQRYSINPNEWREPIYADIPSHWRMPRSAIQIGNHYISERSVTYRNEEYDVINLSKSTPKARAYWLWSRQFDQYSHLWRTHTAAPLWNNDWFFDDVHFSPAAYAHFIPGFSATFQTSADKNTPSTFTLTASVKPVALEGRIRYQFLFQNHDDWQQTGTTLHLRQKITINWGSTIFRPESYASLETDKAGAPSGLCLSAVDNQNHNEHMIGLTPCVLSQQQIWGMDNQQRYHSAAQPDHCLTKDNNTLSLQPCSLNIHQKWFWSNQHIIHYSGEYLAISEDKIVTTSNTTIPPISWHAFKRLPNSRDVIGITQQHSFMH
ncbi:RICIN domain-containing protein [Kistimonas scapharcae]|uniref:RICIN domain-containing protein n=1 Tax=Kistimonas scapharcae TaxID=1036133 RepID=UPI0031E88EEC